jgi:hypothetical protein
MKKFLIAISTLTFGSLQSIAQTGPISEYTFDNTYNDVLGGFPFQNANTSFVNNRNGIASSAMNRSNTSIGNSASIASLPIGANPRTIALWVRSTDVANSSSQREIFSYGSGGTANMFGAYFSNSGGRIAFLGDNDQIITNSPIIINNWFHLVISYNGTNVKAYINGLLRHSFPKTLNTTNSVFSLGRFVGDVDDLKIFDYALTDSAATSLFGLVPQTVAEYTFDNTYNNINGNSSFSNNNTSFVTDRHGISNGALHRTGVSIFNNALISNIPKADNARTISIWVKSTQNNANAGIFNYGTSGNSYFGLSFDNDSLISFNYGDPVISNFTVTPNSWFHFVISYDGVTAKVYLNGVLKNTFIKALNTISSSGNFGLGTFVGDVDDLKIFNYAISGQKVSDLFAELPNIPTNVSTLKNENSSLIVYPNPANTVLNIDFKTTTKQSQLFIMNILGETVSLVDISEKSKIDISSLPNGLYFLKTQSGQSIKFIKE